MTSSIAEAKVIPAQLSFLGIYNPSLGKTDETFRDQILFYYSRVAKESKAASKANGTAEVEADLHEQENERLRQIGLAQGMVDFARTFANGQPVDSVDTEKSRIVMKELESDWWILASVDLTRLPKGQPSSSTGTGDASKADLYEYSSREVSPPGLLIQQLVTAHNTFRLHHGPSLSDFLKRNGREKLCNSLDRFWSRFCRYWEVLLNGNPAVDALSGLKLSAGGELGMGVGEEEWGSGEREVLEDLVHRTDGLMELIVSRFGDETTPSDPQGLTSPEANMPWIGGGRPADATDGVIFGGTGAISRASARDIASWVQQIYVYGDYAYGVRDHPSRRRRRQPKRQDSPREDRAETRQKKRVTNKNLEVDDRDPVTSGTETEGQDEGLDKVPSIPALPPDPRPSLHDRVASQDHAPGNYSPLPPPPESERPGIPPPIVMAAQSSLDEAITRAQKARSASTSDSQPTQSTFGLSDKWVKYLTLGLSTVGKQSSTNTSSSRPSAQRGQSTLSSTGGEVGTETVGQTSKQDGDRVGLTHMDPMPDGHLVESQIAEQKQLENEGYFLVGYRGRLSTTPVVAHGSDEEEEEAGKRLVLRTIHVETLKQIDPAEDDEPISDGSSAPTRKYGMTITKQQRMRVLVYVRRPFIYAFLFDQRAPSLQLGSFYSSLHQHLAPLQKPMSHSTSAAQVAQRIEESKQAAMIPDSPGSSRPGRITQPVYDLLYDPERQTIHSSIPNIPLPGTLAAVEGSFWSGSKPDTDSGWSRLESLNVHSQILSTLEATRHSSGEIERSAKTSRGWWVVWLRLAPSSHLPHVPTLARETSDATNDTTGTSFSQAIEYDTDQCRVAVLVRKASDWTPPKMSSAGSRMASGMFGLGGSADDVTGGANAGWGPAGLAGGMGFDARRYVEGLLSLNR